GAGGGSGRGAGLRASRADARALPRRMPGLGHLRLPALASLALLTWLRLALTVRAAQRIRHRLRGRRWPIRQADPGIPESVTLAHPELDVGRRVAHAFAHAPGTQHATEERGGRHAVQRVELVAVDVEPVVLSPPRQTH